MKWILVAALVTCLAAGTAWGTPWPDYASQAGNTIVGVTVSPSAGAGSLGLVTYTVTIASDASWWFGGVEYPITGVCGLAVYPNAGEAYAGQEAFGAAYDSWNLEPHTGTGTTGTHAFGWSGPFNPIATPGSGTLGPVTIGQATYSEMAPPNVQYLLHVYVEGFGNSQTVWGAPGSTPVPEPGSMALFAVGLGYLAVKRSRRK